MARLAMVLPLATLAMVLLPTLFVTPPSAGHLQRERLVKPSVSAAQEVEMESTSNAVAAVLAAAVVGVLAGLVTAPKVAMADSFPDFFLRRPDYMQGIDAANAAIKPGEIDYVSRSRIEALQFPQTVKEGKAANELMKKAPTKEQRLQREKVILAELAKKTPMLS